MSCLMYLKKSCNILSIVVHSLIFFLSRNEVNECACADARLVADDTNDNKRRWSSHSGRQRNAP